MTMKETDIRRYAELMRELELTAVEIRQEDSMVRLERAVPAPAAVTPVIVPEMAGGCGAGAASSGGAFAGTAGAGAPGAKGSEAPADGCLSVKSPIVGVFYAAPAENAPPYVSIGDRVKKGQILCLIEAMKLMNEIVAEEDGEIAEICATNGQVVEFGTELFRLKR